jgi:hypothetical protein
MSELLALMGWSNSSGHTASYNYFPTRSATVLNQFRSAGLYPAVTAPTFDPPGGTATAGRGLTMSAPVGTIWYTTNGADPRVYGSGAVSPQALPYSGPLAMTATVTLKARVLNAGVWSALNEATFTVGELGLPLRITEINYNPIGGDAYEFIELQNTGTLSLDVGGFSFQGVNCVIPDGTTIPAGATVVFSSAASTNAFAGRYPSVAVFGTFTGTLDNGGERLAILDRNGQTVTAVHYDDAGGWPKAADGGGGSLEIIDPRGDPNAPANWRASALANGTPGLPPSAPLTVGDIVLDEVMSENLATIGNGGAFPDWIELRNRGSSAVSLAQWSLTDDSNPRKFVFPANTQLAAGGYLVVWCDTDTNAPGLHTGFALGRNGDNVFLYDANTNRVDALTFGLQIADLSVGRIGDLWQLNQPTPGSNNVAAVVGAATNLVINEWLANSSPGAPDWIEVYNTSSNRPVAMFGLYFGASNALFQIQLLSFIGPRDFVQLFADESSGADHLDFKLTALGGRDHPLRLFGPAD